MQKEKIIALLEQNHLILTHWLEKQPLENWEKGPSGKWTTGQQVLHLIQSMKPLNKVMKLPRFILKYKFGTSNRETREYQIVVNRYLDKLSKTEMIISPFSQNMMTPKSSDKEDMIKELISEKNKLQKQLRSWNEKDLDKYILPHPLMGRMPIREITMWTGYHTEHHFNQLAKNY